MAVDFSNKSSAEALSQAETHINDDGKHREINDSGTGSTDLWSAQKLTSELGDKSDVGHTHVETDITDLDHDAQKIKGSPVEAPVAGQDGYLMYWDETTSTIKWTLNPVGGVNSHFFGFDNGSNASGHTKGDYRGVNTDDFRISFAVPADFVSLISIELVYIANNTGTVTWSATTDYGAIGQNYAMHSEQVSGIQKSQTKNNHTAVDLSGAFTNLANGDFCGLRIQCSQTQFYLGVKLTYNRG